MTSKKTANRRGTESAAPDGPVRDGGNVLGADPHKRTLTATVLDERGGVLGTSVFNVSGEGHRAMEAWALSFGPVSRWGIEGAAGIGRHTAMFLARRGHDVRAVCPNRTNERARGAGRARATPGDQRVQSSDRPGSKVDGRALVASSTLMASRWPQLRGSLMPWPARTWRRGPHGVDVVALGPRSRRPEAPGRHLPRRDRWSGRRRT